MHPVISVLGAKVPSYTLCMAAGAVLAFAVAYIRFRHLGGEFKPFLLTASVAFTLALYGAHAAYYLTSYGLLRLTRELLRGDLSGLAAGGFVYYGGLAAGIAGGYLVVRLYSYDYSMFSDAIAPALPLGHAVGRLGCTLAGCCYGVPYGGPFAIHSIQAPTCARFPIQPFEAVLNLGLFVFLTLYARRPTKRHDTLSLYVVSYAVIRFALEFLRDDPIRGSFAGLSSSQWISLLILAGCLASGIRRLSAQSRQTGIYKEK